MRELFCFCCLPRVRVTFLLERDWQQKLKQPVRTKNRPEIGGNVTGCESARTTLGLVPSDAFHGGEHLEDEEPGCNDGGEDAREELKEEEEVCDRHMTEQRLPQRDERKEVDGLRRVKRPNGEQVLEVEDEAVQTANCDVKDQYDEVALV